MELNQAYLTMIEEKLASLIKLNRKREDLLQEIINSLRAKLAGVTYKGHYVKTITESDLHKTSYKLHDAIGPTQKQDIGKQVFEIDGIYKVESNEQRDRRLNREPSAR